MSFNVITHLGRAIHVLNISPEWTSKVALTPSYRSDIGTGISGRESRTDEDVGLRFELSLSLQMVAAESDAFRYGIATMADDYIGVPLWFDVLDGSTWSDRIIDPQYIYDFSAGAILAAGSTLTTGNLYAPLYVGKLQDLPKSSSITDTISEVSLTFQEDSPYDYHLGVNASVSQDPFPTSIVPDWSSHPTEKGEYNRTYDEVGLGRERGVDNTDFAFRWTQEARFSLQSRTDIRTFLSFFLANKGQQKSFTMPWWFNPGPDRVETPASTKVRFSEASVKLDFITDSVAEVQANFIQLPWEISGTSGETPVQAQRAQLFKFTYQLPTPVVTRLTSWPTPITTTDGTYNTALINYKDISQSLELDKNEIQIESYAFSGNPLMTYVPFQLEAKLLLEVHELDPSNVSTDKIIWTGEIVSTGVEGKKITAKGLLFGWTLERKVSSFVISPTCNYTLYSTPCGTLKSAYQKTGTLASASGTSITITTSATDAANYYAIGYIEIGSGATWERRAIKASAPGTGTQVLTIDRPLTTTTSGQSVVFYPGCDGTKEMCMAKFNNYNRFGGTPYVPLVNPTLSTAQQANSDRKK